MWNYEQIKSIPVDILQKQIAFFMEEDIPEIDYTAEGTIPKTTKICAYIEAQQDLVFAGGCIIKAIFDNSEYELELLHKDGDRVANNSKLAIIKGNARNILQYERTLLNILQRLCGIATVTAKYVKAVKGKFDVLDTRKTLPGFRLLDKYAVYCGGGRNHRLNLSAGVMIKDNHISAAGSIRKAVDNILAMKLSIPIEVEIDTLDQLKELGDISGIDAFLLDNMSPERVDEVFSYLKTLNIPKEKFPFIEASGGITLETITLYIGTEIDAVSIGALTHSVIAADMHMEFEEI